MQTLRLTRRTTADLVVSLGKTAAQITAQFAPVPALGPAADLLCGIIQLCQNVTQNRHAAVQLRDRCHRIGLVVYDMADPKEKPASNENIATAIESLTQCLKQVHDKMNSWTLMNRVQGFLHQDEVSKDIERCHVLLSDCLGSFQLISHTEIHDWQAQFKLDSEEDHRELVAYLVNIENSQTITNEALQSQSSDIQRMMAMMQQLMGNNLRTANQQHNGLSSNLYDLQFKSRELLPDFHLRSGEVIRIGQFPISGTSAMDIYEGLYLGREKVAIKVVRAVNSNENSMRRFKRECDIWKKLWNLDQGQHVLPFYGFCQEDGPFPYMVSPWQANGTALTYVKSSNDKIDYLKLVRGVALGLQVLHGMSPHVVHGDLKASNVVIDVAGNPLIADFGLSRIVEDITGIPFSQSRGVSDSYRWFAPEVCIGQGVLSLSSDVYAYGMTVLEIFTHEQPYNNIKHTTEVVIRSAKGEHPPKPMDLKVIRRGLDDNMWKLLSLCWATEPLQRPTIQQVLELFPQ
ncbi:TKL/TKL-ccin protein kinase [Mycena sanguinolenta]|uniref:TKL/TKL-ccin protein kinase n=1 Tax=Mycena sanguinolenta TaxID=230812 RepID=A0A8H6Y6G7_9AGAR|nr:TKL/TKL-ccin protein kinase [Mycena sanguinolenta]